MRCNIRSSQLVHLEGLYRSRFEGRKHRTLLMRGQPVKNRVKQECKVQLHFGDVAQVP